MKEGFILITLYIIYTPQNLIKQAKNLSYPQPLYIVCIKLTNTIYSIYKNNLIKIYKMNNFSYNLEIFSHYLSELILLRHNIHIYKGCFW